MPEAADKKKFCHVPPPRDEDGYVLPHDDHAAIPDDAFVVRYVHKDQLAPSDDGRKLLSSGAFSETSKERDRYQSMSIDILNRLQRDKVDPCTRLPSDHEGAVLIRAGSLRKLGLKVGPDPMRSKTHIMRQSRGLRVVSEKR